MVSAGQHDCHPMPRSMPGCNAMDTDCGDGVRITRLTLSLGGEWSPWIVSAESIARTRTCELHPGLLYRINEVRFSDFKSRNRASRGYSCSRPIDVTETHSKSIQHPVLHLKQRIYEDCRNSLPPFARDLDLREVFYDMGSMLANLAG